MKQNKRNKIIKRYYKINPETLIIECPQCGAFLQKWHPTIEYDEAWAKLKDHFLKNKNHQQQHTKLH